MKTRRTQAIPPGAGRRNGWTLLEMLVAVTGGLLIMTSVGSVYVFMRRTLDATYNYAVLDNQSRNALDMMSRDIRQCGGLTNYDATHLWFTNLDGTLLKYSWDTNALTLSYTNGTLGLSGTLLTNCTYLKFTEFQRNPSNGTTMTFMPLGTNAVAAAKVIVIDWICKKTNYTTLTDSESVQTAKVVLRN